PIPGSPPTSTAEAGTRPPPSTRSSSSMPVAARGGGARAPRGPPNPPAWPAAALLAAPGAAAPGRGVIVSAVMVFHSSQVSQRPSHFGGTAPQDWQTKRVVALAMKLPNAALASAHALVMPPSMVMVWPLI